MTRTVEHLQSGFDAWRITTLGPLRFPTFRALGLATMTAYFGAVIQAVGAAWQMTSLGVSPDWVAYVQAVSLLPTVLFALPAGALADIGTIEKGKYADLLHVEGDPLADIGALRNVVRVWNGGALVVESWRFVQ